MTYFSRGLPVGHSSGPDHCVLAESPYGEEAIKVDSSPNVMMNIGHHEMGLTFIAQQSQVRSSFILGPEAIKRFSCSAQLRLNFILLINVGILTFISRTNY